MTTLGLEATLVQKWRDLPADRQVEVLDFVESLARRTANRTDLRNPIGLFADCGIEISDQDIADARSEMWQNFPRDLEL